MAKGNDINTKRRCKLVCVVANTITTIIVYYNYEIHVNCIATINFTLQFNVGCMAYTIKSLLFYY